MEKETTFENISKSIYNKLTDEDKRAIFDYSPEARDPRVVNKIIGQLKLLASSNGNPEQMDELLKEKSEIVKESEKTFVFSKYCELDKIVNGIKKQAVEKEPEKFNKQQDERIASEQVDNEQTTKEVKKIRFTLAFSNTYKKQIHDMSSENEKIESLRNNIINQLKEQLDDKTINFLIEKKATHIVTKGIFKEKILATNTQNKGMIDFFAKYHADTFSSMDFDNVKNNQVNENINGLENASESPVEKEKEEELQERVRKEQKDKKEKRQKEAKENMVSGSIEGIRLDDILTENDLKEILNKKPEERFDLIKHKITNFFSDRTNAFSVEGSPVDFDGKFTEKEKTAINALANNFEIDIKEIAERKANNERIHMESIDLVDELEAEFEKLKPQLASMPPAQRKYAIERMVLKVCTGMGNNLTLDFLQNFKPNGMNIKLPGISPTQLKNIQNLNLIEFLVRYYNIKATHTKMNIQQVKEDVAELIPEAMLIVSPASSITTIGTSIINEIIAPEKSEFEFDENLLRKIRYKTEPLTPSEQSYMDAYKAYKQKHVSVECLFFTLIITKWSNKMKFSC